MIGNPGSEAAITFTLVRARHCVQARQGAHAKFRADVCSCLHRLPGRKFPVGGLALNRGRQRIVR